MRLLGRDISTEQLMGWVQERLTARGLSPSREGGAALDGVEPRVDPLSFNLDALSRHADATQGLPVETHRGGLSGLAVVGLKRAFRATCQVFINEALARQVVFNGHARDSYAQLSAEVLRLRERVVELEGERAPPPPPAPKRAKRKPE